MASAGSPDKQHITSSACFFFVFFFTAEREEGTLQRQTLKHAIIIHFFFHFFYLFIQTHSGERPGSSHFVLHKNKLRFCLSKSIIFAFSSV